MNGLLILAVFFGVAVNALCTAMFNRFVVESGKIPVISMALRAVRFRAVGVEHHQLAVGKILFGMPLARVADIALIGNSALFENRLIN